MSLKIKKKIRSVLGHVGYNYRFIEKFTKIVAPLFKLLSKDVIFLWGDKCQCAFETLKKKLFATLILRGPNWSLLVHISTDALDTALGDVLR